MSEHASYASVCHECTAMVVNSDDSAIDYHHSGQEADEVRERRWLMVETLTSDAPVGEHSPGGYWECWICEDTLICGTAYLFTIAD